MATVEEAAQGTPFIQASAKQENGDDNLPKEEAIKDNEGVQVKPKLQKEKKIGHRRVDASTGQTTYKKTPSSALSGSIQRGISHTVAGLSSKPERDVLMQDFQVVETILFPSEGSNITPAHHFGDFTFRTYAPTAFRYFRDLFGIRPDDYMLSISEPLTELSNPGASGSLFFVTHDDEFIIKTVQHKEAEFLQKLLPGYYMNLVQNPRTLLPKFYGLYCVQSGGKNIRIVVMNNLLPSKIKMHLKFDLKGSTYKRKASKYERAKKNPVYKDLDLLNDLPDGVLMEADIHTELIKTMQRDCLVLRSFKIMDYSMLLAIHNQDQEEREKPSLTKDLALNNQETKIDSTAVAKSKVQDHSRNSSMDYNSDDTAATSSVAGTTGLKGNYASRNAVISSTMLRNKYTTDLDLWAGGIPAKNTKGERLLLFCGIIDILQCYKLKKKLEHTLKSMIADADTVSVHRPAFYCRRFESFMRENVFTKSAVVKTQPSSRTRGHSSKRANTATLGTVGSINGAGSSATLPTSTPSSGISRLQGRPDLLPNESPRSLSKDDEDPNITKNLQSNPSLSLPDRQSFKGVSPSRETTFEASSNTTSQVANNQKDSPERNSVRRDSIEVTSSGVIRSEQVELSVEEGSANNDAQERPQAGEDVGDSMQLKVKRKHETAESDVEFDTAL